MIAGIAFINHANEAQTQEIFAYVSSLKDNIKSADNINRTALLIQSLQQNITAVVIIWFLGCTIVGNFFIYIAVVYKGFSMGYTISAIVATLGAKSGSIFVISSLLLQNLIFLPAILILAQSGLKLYQNLRQNKYTNMKLEFMRHTLIALIAVVASVIASFIEIYISTNFLIFFKDFL